MSAAAALVAGVSKKRRPGSIPSSLLVRASSAPPSIDDQAVQGPKTFQQTSPVVFTNEEDDNCTIIKLHNPKGRSGVLQVSSVFMSNGIAIQSASLNDDKASFPSEDGHERVDIYRVTKDATGQKIPENEWPPMQRQLTAVLGGQKSAKPAIFGAAEALEVTQLRPFANEGDIDALESAAYEMSNAATTLVSIERDIIAIMADIENGVSNTEEALLSRQQDRSEASSLLERRMAAMEAILASRRKVLEAQLEQQMAKPKIPDFMLSPPQPAIRTGGPAAGNGYEMILQGFNWESCKEPWYKKMASLAEEISQIGFTSVWLPPASDSVSPQGYMPRDLYDLNSKYGSETELREMIQVLHDYNLKVVADIVINHRCAHYQGDGGKWNKFGGRLAWDKSVICSNNPAFAGTGSYKQCEDYEAAPNIDHTQERVRRDISEWMKYLRKSIGFDGWRFDFVKGYEGKWIQEYVDATVPELAFGEYWDTCSYTDGVLNYNQDAHRQRTVDWCDATGGTAAAFDFTTKGILQEALSKGEYWRLIDSQGRPPGVIGIWPSRAVTFIENHDTGSTLNHWPFPWKHLPQGYAYLLTHPGTPCVFFDHLYFDKDLRKYIIDLINVRKEYGLNHKSEVLIRKAYKNVYSAVIDKKIAMKIGPGDWSPESDKVEVGQKEWKLLTSGPNFAVWGAVF
jgi:alpha-amylase